MKKLFKLFIIAISAMTLFIGSTVTTASAAEVRPLFNYFANEQLAYDAETETYSIYGAQGGLPRLSSVDYQNYLLKTDYSDDVIKFDYQFTEYNLNIEDWCMYFTFRNFTGESPLWLTDYSAYLVFFRNFIELRLFYSNGQQMIFTDENGEVVSAKIDHDPIIFMNQDEEIVVNDDWHSIEIHIDDETGDVTVYRNKGTEDEGVISVSTITEKGKIGILEAGGYSFSTHNCNVNLRNLYFEDPDKTEYDDEMGRYEAAQNPPEEPEQPDDPADDKPAKKGCGSSVSATLLLAIPTMVAAAFVLRKKEND